MRFSCPSAAANSGRPVADAEKDLVHLSRLLEQHVGRSADSAPPPLLQAGQQLPWPDVCRVVQVLVEIVQDRGDRLERRLRKCLAVARVCGQTQLDSLQGNKLSKYLQAVRTGVEADVPREAGDLPPPDRLLGRVLFRVLLAIFAQGSRRVPGLSHPETAGPSARRLALRQGPWSRASRQRIPAGNQLRGGRTDAAGCRRKWMRSGTLLCGQTEFAAILRAAQLRLAVLGRPRIAVLTLPMILWLRRAFTGLPPVQAVQKAIQMVDDHFGGDPMLGLPHIQYLCVPWPSVASWTNSWPGIAAETTRSRGDVGQAFRAARCPLIAVANPLLEFTAEPGPWPAQLGGARRVHHAGVFHPAPEMGGEVGPALAVLALEARTSRVVQDRPQGAELLARDRGPIVDRQAGHLLPAAPAHHARLRGVLGQTLGPDDRADAAEQPAHGAGGIAGEGQVIGIAGVGEAVTAGQAIQAAVEPAAQARW